MLALAIFFHNITNSLQTNFTGLIIKGFGYNTYEAVLLGIPGGIIFAVVMLIVSFTLSTKWGDGKRILFIILCYIPGIAASLILYLSPVGPTTKESTCFPYSSSVSWPFRLEPSLPPRKQHCRIHQENRCWNHVLHHVVRGQHRRSTGLPFLPSPYLQHWVAVTLTAFLLQYLALLRFVPGLLSRK